MIRKTGVMLGALCLFLLATSIVADRTPAQATRVYGPKPDETGVPTPPPTIIVPMTPAPTLAVPNEKPTPAHPLPTIVPPRPEDPFILGAAVTRIPDRGIVLREATVVAIGVAKAIGPARWTTPDGQRPPNPHLPRYTYSIYRPMQFDVEQYLLGEATDPTLYLSLYGGTIGRDAVTISGDDSNEFQEGQRYIVYLRPTQREHHQVPDGTALWQVLDRYSLTADGQATNMFGSEPLPQLLDEIEHHKK